MWACHFGERVGIYSRHVATPFTHLACRKPVRVWILAAPPMCQNSTQTSEVMFQGSSIRLSFYPSPASQSYLSFWTRLQSHLPQDPLQSPHLESLPLLFAFFLFIVLLTFSLVLILGAGLLLRQSESRGLLGPYGTPSSFCICALRMCLLRGRCPINIYQVEITQIQISG